MILRLAVLALSIASIQEAVGEPIHRRDDFSASIEKQNEISLQGVLNNFGPTGSQAPGASAGVIIASPSTEDPNYYYTWTRDAALTMRMIVDEFIHGKEELRSYIQDYLKAQAILQTVSNPSGALSSGRGLGEPKFYANITRFNGDWGRPQRDGPALRATALITYAKWLLDTSEGSDAQEATEKVWPVVQNDLNYVAQYWNSTGFDLWEEVSGSSFFTVAAQHRALVEGSALAKQLGQSSTAYDSQATNLLCFLQTFWNGKYAVANINTQSGFSRAGIDSNTVLTSIASFDPEAPCDDVTFQPCSARALANLKVYVDAFRSIYTINKDTANTSAVATGRYPEDVYYEGNPWYLTTLAVAEQLYDAIQQWNSINSLTISDTDLSFWQTVYPSASPGTYTPGSELSNLLDAVLAYADGFVKVALKYTPSTGALAEQFSRENGTAVSARDLTWSYASFVTMRAARLSATSDYPQIGSWGASSVSAPSGACSASSSPGVYKPAIAAGAPPDAGGCTILMTFNVNASTYFGENVYLSGNTTDLGAWRPADALPGSAEGYSEERPLWTFEVELPQGTGVEYSYVRKESDGSFLFEERNRTLEVPFCTSTEGGNDKVVEDAWVGPVGSPS